MMCQKIMIINDNKKLLKQKIIKIKIYPNLKMKMKKIFKISPNKK